MKKLNESSDERPAIKLWNYIFENCGCQYIKTERAYSAYISLAGYDHQEYELDEHSAKVKLSDSVSAMRYVLEWYNRQKTGTYGK